MSRIVLITGAAGGIGTATAEQFVDAGDTVVVSDLDAIAAERTAEALRVRCQDDQRAWAQATDVADRAAVGTLFEAIRKRHGRLDCAFLNAGIGGGGTPLLETDDAIWDACLRVNLDGTYNCLKQAVRLMLASGGGAIVNNCSILGVNGGASAAYTATKHGIAGLTKSIAVAYSGQGIRCNAVCPGLIDAGLGARTVRAGGAKAEAFIKLHPAGRPGTAVEVANAVRWLCSPESSFVTGELMMVDGGYSAR